MDNSKFEYFISEAIKQAAKSEEKFKHGAVIIDTNKQKIIAKGYNKKSFYSHGFTIHAEVDAYIKINKKFNNFKNTILIVVRINNQNQLKMSKPCQRCQEFLLKTQIDKFYYSTD